MLPFLYNIYSKKYQIGVGIIYGKPEYSDESLLE